MADDINSLLKEIIEVGGVGGVILATGNGQLVAHRGLNLRQSILEAIVHYILRITIMHAEKNKPVKENNNTAIGTIAKNVLLIFIPLPFFIQIKVKSTASILEIPLSFTFWK